MKLTIEHRIDASSCSIGILHQSWYALRTQWPFFLRSSVLYMMQHNSTSVKPGSDTRLIPWIYCLQRRFSRQQFGIIQDIQMDIVKSKHSNVIVKESRKLVSW